MSLLSPTLLPQANGADCSSFIHMDSDETDEYQFDAAFLQYTEFLEEYVYKHVEL